MVIDYFCVVFCAQLVHVRNLMLVLMDLNKVDGKGGHV
jgi:hypothetical protein